MALSAAGSRGGPRDGKGLGLSGPPEMKADPDTIQLFDTAITNLPFELVCQRIEERIRNRVPGYIVTPNVDHVCKCYRIPEFRATYEEAFLCLPDGVPIMWAARLLGKPLQAKLSGSDIVPWLCEFSACRGFSVYFLGGRKGAAQRTAETLQERHPSLHVAGYDCPPFGFHADPEIQQRVVDRLREAAPDICFVALGCPKQEYWMRRTSEESGVPIMMGVGAAFDFIAGQVRRAPVWVQKCGFEWLWRLAQEPRRLWRRYLWDDMLFFKLLWREARKGARP